MKMVRKEVEWERLVPGSELDLVHPALLLLRLLGNVPACFLMVSPVTVFRDRNKRGHLLTIRRVNHQLEVSKVR